MLRWRHLIFLIREIKKGLSLSLRRLPREYALACTSMRLSVIYCTSQTSAPVPAERWRRHRLDFFLRSSSDPQTVGIRHMAQSADQDRKVGGERLHRVTATGVRLLLLQSQPLTVVILAWFKGLLHCQQERGPSLLAALYFIRGSSLRWVMPELWLTDYGAINKCNLILIKSDKASVWRIQAGQALLYTETKGLICGDVCRVGLRSDIFYH